MPTVSDLESAYYAQYGYTGSITDMQYQYYSNPPTLDSYGYVRVATVPGTAGVVPLAGYTFYHRVVEGGTFSKIRMSITVSSGNICIAAYKNTGSGLNAKPGAQIATTGAIACPVTVGINDIPMGSLVTVAAGDWLSLSSDNAVNTFIGVNGPGSAIYIGGTGNFTYEAAFPAPAVANSIGAANARMFSMIGVP